MERIVVEKVYRKSDIFDVERRRKARRGKKPQ
jgi:hypothetical protein